MSIDLEALGNAIATQDNRATAHPLFCVFQKRSIVTDEDYDHDRIEYYDKDDSESIEEEHEPRIYELLKKLDKSGELPDRYRRVAVKEVDEFVTACFTEQSCKDYIEANKHNLEKPFIYAASLYRNSEMIGLREFLLTKAESNITH
jgi:hypothetical protein